LPSPTLLIVAVALVPPPMWQAVDAVLQSKSCEPNLLLQTVADERKLDCNVPTRERLKFDLPHRNS
jgi:hypothetical protein